MVRPDDEANEKEKFVFLFLSKEERKTFYEVKKSYPVGHTIIKTRPKALFLF